MILKCLERLCASLGLSRQARAVSNYDGPCGTETRRLGQDKGTNSGANGAVLCRTAAYVYLRSTDISYSLVFHSCHFDTFRATILKALHNIRASNNGDVRSKHHQYVTNRSFTPFELKTLTPIAPFDSEEDPLAGLFPEYEQLKQAVQTKDLSLVDATLSEIMRGAPKEILADFSRAISDAIGLNAVDIVQYLVDQQVPVDGDVVQTAVEASSIESLRILLPHWDINQVVRSGSTTALR